MNIFKVVGGVLWFVIFGILLYYVWDWVVILGAVISDDFLVIVYYSSAIIMSFICVFLVPFYLIMTGFKGEAGDEGA